MKALPIHLFCVKKQLSTFKNKGGNDTTFKNKGGSLTNKASKDTGLTNKGSKATILILNGPCFNNNVYINTDIENKCTKAN